jgi:hypothetical protein
MYPLLVRLLSTIICFELPNWQQASGDLQLWIHAYNKGSSSPPPGKAAAAAAVAPAQAVDLVISLSLFFLLATSFHPCDTCVSLAACLQLEVEKLKARIKQLEADRLKSQQARGAAAAGREKSPSPPPVGFPKRLVVDCAYYYTLRALHSNMFVDMDGGSSADGTGTGTYQTRRNNTALVFIYTM